MTTTLTGFLTPRLAELKEEGLYNVIDSLEGENNAVIRLKGRSLINLSSNNYLGLATDERLKQACIKATNAYGVGAGAVRTINGTMVIHDQLEAAIAKFKGTEAAIAFQLGFNCNMGAISAIMGKGDAILSDALNHASIIDGCRLSGAKVIRVKHQDMSDLRQQAKAVVESGMYEKVMYITDGVFSMDGNVAKIREIVKIAEEFNLITYVDDAHGSGVMGGGAGTVKHFGCADKVDLQMGTLSKAIGVVGGYVAGSQQLIDWLKSSGKAFLVFNSFNTRNAAACIEAIKLMEQAPELIEKLWENGRYLSKGLKALGFDVGDSDTPITPCIIGDEKQTQQFSQALFKASVYAKAIVFPTVPLGTGRIRNMPTSAHTKGMLDEVLTVYKKIGHELGVVG